MHVYMYEGVYMYMYVYLCVCICVYVYMYMGGQYFYRCIRTHGYVCRRKKYRTPRDSLERIHMWLTTFVCLHMWLTTFVCLHMWLTTFARRNKACVFFLLYILKLGLSPEIPTQNSETRIIARDSHSNRLKSNYTENTVSMY